MIVMPQLSMSDGLGKDIRSTISNIKCCDEPNRTIATEQMGLHKVAICWMGSYCKIKCTMVINSPCDTTVQRCTFRFDLSNTVSERRSVRLQTQEQESIIGRNTGCTIQAAEQGVTSISLPSNLLKITITSLPTTNHHNYPTPFIVNHAQATRYSTAVKADHNPPGRHHSRCPYRTTQSIPHVV